MPSCIQLRVKLACIGWVLVLLAQILGERGLFGKGTQVWRPGLYLFFFWSGATASSLRMLSSVKPDGWTQYIIFKVPFRAMIL